VEFKDRRSFFFAVLFIFLGAMHGLIFSDNMLWIYFFWEITSVCSFLLIGYSQTTEATNNSFRALWMNLLGGLGFAIAIVYSVMELKVSSLQSLVQVALADDRSAQLALVAIALLAFAGLTKSAQLPFSGWLLGAMVAPTPTSALLHSATMVKAGVYLLLRLAPAMAGNDVGLMITTIGGFTFFATSCLAISQSDGKKVLAYSTISNLGLITACAGVGKEEAVWAGILLMMFHAVSKSLLFLTVGAIENSIGSRNIEDMHGLIIKLPKLCYVMIIGIAGMFLAPFGMLISKWAALKAFVDSNSVLLVIFLVFGSATTLFYWTKWLCSLIAVHSHSEAVKDRTKKVQWFSLSTLATLMVALCVTFPVASTYIIEPFLQGMFQKPVGDMIGRGNLNIMIMMLCVLLILPVMARILTFGRKQEPGLSYMSGINAGDNRKFIDSFDAPKQMYLSNWYVTEWFGEKKLLHLSLILATTALIVLLTLSIGGAIV
jgi:ech hydrogenase subunit A